MTPRALQTLIAIAEAGSFQEAARRRNMTLSAVSMQMKTLEQSLDAALFDRSHRPPQLTPMGRRVVAQARVIVAAHEDLAAVCGPADGALKGDFRLGFVLTASVRLLPSFLAQATDRFPRASFQVVTGLSDSLVARVENGGLDAAVVTAIDDLPPALTVSAIAREDMVYCLPADARDWPIARCMRELIFFHFLPDAGIGRLIARHLNQIGGAPDRVIVLDTVEAAAECVRAGVGFSVLPAPDVRRYARDDIVLRPLEPTAVTRTLALVTRGATPLDAARDDMVAALTANEGTHIAP